MKRKGNEVLKTGMNQMLPLTTYVLVIQRFPVFKQNKCLPNQVNCELGLHRQAWGETDAGRAC